MSYLDQLRRDAERARQEKAEREAGELALQAIYSDEICPRLLAIHQFLFDFTAQIREAEWEVEVGFPFPGIGRVPLFHHDYRVHIDSTQNPREVSLVIFSRASAVRRYECSPDSEPGLRAFLGSHRVKCETWVDRLPGGKRTVMCEAHLAVASVVRFMADIPRSALVVEASDFNAPGMEMWQFGVSEPLDSAWLDNLAGFLLRKSSELVVRPEPRSLTDAERAVLKEKLDAAMTRQSALEAVEPDIQRVPNNVLDRLRDTLRNLRRQ